MARASDMLLAIAPVITFLVVQVMVVGNEFVPSNSSMENRDATSAAASKNKHYRLNTTLCTDYCENGCVSYITPLFKCYSPRKLFPKDPSWGENDLLDANLTFSAVGQVTFQRLFYSTNDGTCSSDSESQMLPLNECVGPFGSPRPWGRFELLA